MLTNTFCCFDGLTVSAERRLWSAGCLEWRELLVLDQPSLSASKLARVRAEVRQAEIALEVGLADWFLNRLRPPETIRVLPHFFEGAGFLDIETTGLGRTDRITTVVLSVGGTRRCYVRGRNLDELLRHLKDVSLLVTYNGAGFDVPRLRSEFRIDLPVPNLDLRPCLEALGYKGGLKRCEELMGITRTGETALTGRDAVELWDHYQAQGDEDSLLRLLRYNLHDVLSLETLAVKVFNRVVRGFPRGHVLPLPRQPDPETFTLRDVL
jgi:hypothetical protein